VLEDSLFGVSAGLLQVLRRNNPEANVSGPHRVAMEAIQEGFARKKVAPVERSQIR
jgi:hypothetical protein